MTHYVIIGSGNAGVTAAETIREHDKRNKITLINGEGRAFYFRSGLLEFLKGELGEEQMMARPLKFFNLKTIDVLDGINVQKIVPETKQVIIDKD
ncbi:NAD(P)/FAD-dependent oxidoreductase, partial [Candidatus Woesearchaeota archaeon]|nr:NAD(P)/FAD-dependent oxidoreductase [Candidatus Woesearchaeota archaeon]